MKTTCLRVIAVLVGCVCCLVAFVFFCKVISSGLSFCGNGLNLEASSQSGAFLGGVIGTILSAGTFFWTFISLLEQRKEQRLEHVEQRFFLMINLHRQNVEELVFDTSGRDQDPNLLPEADPVHRGRAVFRDIFRQLEESRKIVDETLSGLDAASIYEVGYLQKITENPFIKANRIDPLSLALIDISYCIVHFGVGKDGEKALREHFEGKYKIEQVNDIIKMSQGRVVREGSKIKYFGGHQFRLEHFFRHLYKSICYIDRKDFLSPEEKKEYVGLLQAQLSNNEEKLLFYHSLSQIGRGWEMEDSSRKLISDYKLIHDIFPGQLIDDVASFYPKQFEG